MDQQERDYGQTLGGKVFRRKKRFQGATWTPTQSSAASGDGEWCASCHSRHGYSTMGVSYEKRSDGPGFKVLWSCRKSGLVIKEMLPSDMPVDSGPDEGEVDDEGRD